MYGIYIDPNSKLSMTRQVCNQLRSLIETQELVGGTRLLPTRVLAKEWGIARNVVIEVYEQLTAEGYLDCRVGSGTFVAEGIIRPPSIQQMNVHHASHVNTPIDSNDKDVITFATGIPDLGSFPKKSWAKYMKAAAEMTEENPLDYGDIKGDESLRKNISEYLYRAKGIHCPIEQLIIVSGASEGMFLLAQSLSPRFHSLYIEDPTIDFTRNIFQLMNYKLKPVQVDKHGMNIESLVQFEPGHLALLTPSHQFPTGSLLSIQRRHKAIRMAEEADIYLIEDDYDSEFRLRGVPVPPLHTLAPSRVIYVGTFSKILSPSLRIGFMIVPPSLVDTVANMKYKLNLFSPLILQKALSHLISDGQLERHIHTMKNVYKKRRNLLIAQLHHYFGQDISVLGDDAGMHLQVQFRADKLGELNWNDTIHYGLMVENVDEYRMVGGRSGPNIVLGYGNLSAEMIEAGVRRLNSFVTANKLNR